MHPVQSITSITYKDANGNTQTLSTDVYLLDDYALPNAIVLKYSQSWPDTYEEQNAITVTYVAGQSTSDLPQAIKQAMLLTIADFYENRTDYVKRLPTAAQYLLNQYRVFVF